MKKISLTLAALAVFGSAHAQSSVTLFGNIDATLARGTGSISNRNQLTSGGLATSMIGFRGVEDLGGGMLAGFWLEAQFAVDTGAGSTTSSNNQTTGTPVGGGGLTFNRRSTVSLSGNWGQVILGRDYTPIFWSNVVFDPFTVNGVGTNQIFLSQITGAGLAAGPYTGGANALSSRASNSVSYAYGFAPNGTTIIGEGGLYAHAMYFLGENSSGTANASDGSGAGLRLGYVQGPVNVAGSYLASKYLGPAVAAPGSVVAGDIKTASLGGSYDFGVAKVRALVSRDNFSPRTGTGWLLAVTAPMGQGVWRAAYSTYKSDATGNPKSGKLAFGYVYNLSKRTALYATYARVGNSGGAAQAVNAAVTAANASSSGFDLGIRHSF